MRPVAYHRRVVGRQPVTSPVQVGTTTWNGVAVGTVHTCATSTDGTLWCWGVPAQLQMDLPMWFDPTLARLAVFVVVVERHDLVAGDGLGEVGQEGGAHAGDALGGTGRACRRGGSRRRRVRRRLRWIRDRYHYQEVTRQQPLPGELALD